VYDIIPFLTESSPFSTPEFLQLSPPSFSRTTAHFARIFNEISNRTTTIIRHRMEAAIWAIYFYAISHSPFAAFFTYSPTIFPFLLSPNYVHLSVTKQIVLVRLIDNMEQLFIMSGVKKKGGMNYVFILLFHI
jgi:hypothetical protein